MPSLTELAGIPFYSAYNARTEQNRRSGLQDLQEAGSVMALKEQVEARRREMEMRQFLQQHGGDIEKAAQAAIQAGNFAGAAKLAPLIEAKRKATAAHNVGPGGALVGPEGNIIYERPFAPREESHPEIVKLQNFLRLHGDKIPPQGRAQIEARIQRLAQGEGGESRPFGGGATGGALEMMSRLAPAYAAGQLTPEQDRLFETSVAHYSQPRQFQDPDSGLMVTRQPQLPQFVQDAVNRRRSARPGPQPSPSPTPAAPDAAPQARTERPSRTAWDLASLTTGPVPAAAEMLSRTPLVGDMVQAPQFTQARNYVPQLQRDLVRVLQNNPRFPEGERKAIEKEISIEPKLFDNSTAYRDRLVGIDDALAVRERNAFATAQSARVGREERIQAMNVLNAIRNFRGNLGVPPRIRTEDEYNELPSGSVYIDTRDGKPKRKK